MPTIKAKGSSYGTEAVNIFSERAAATAFSFMRMHSNDNADVEFNFRGDGQGLADGGTFNNPADYAEFFEWKDGNTSDEDRVGYSVILDGNKIVKATSSDEPPSPSITIPAFCVPVVEPRVFLSPKIPPADQLVPLYSSEQVLGVGEEHTPAARAAFSKPAPQFILSPPAISQSVPGI